jgi:DNA-binding HxlR family transcriptional regulator
MSIHSKEDKKLEISENNCPVKTVVEILGGKWAFSIVYFLLQGTKRFKEIEHGIVGINTRMLVKELKSMQENKIITRKAYPTIPPTVEYTLTEKGKKLEPILNELYKWGKEYV